MAKSNKALALRERERLGAPSPFIVAYIERPNEIRAARFQGMQPDVLGSVLNRAASGELEDWFDVAERMLETDAHLASVLETRNDHLTGCEFSIEPGKAKAGDEGLAQEGAHFLREQLQSVDDIESIFADLNSAIATGLAAQEHVWCMEGGYWNSYPEFRASKLFRYGDDWRTQVRDADRQWIVSPPASSSSTRRGRDRRSRRADPSSAKSRGSGASSTG